MEEWSPAEDAVTPRQRALDAMPHLQTERASVHPDIRNMLMEKLTGGFVDDWMDARPELGGLNYEEALVQYESAHPEIYALLEQPEKASELAAAFAGYFTTLIKSLYEQAKTACMMNLADNFLPELGVSGEQESAIFQNSFNRAFGELLRSNPNFLRAWENELNRPDIVEQIVERMLANREKESVSLSQAA